jgi:hypothetical protein
LDLNLGLEHSKKGSLRGIWGDFRSPLLGLLRKCSTLVAVSFMKLLDIVEFIGVGVNYIPLRVNIKRQCNIIFPLRDVIFPKMDRIFSLREYRTEYIP